MAKPRFDFNLPRINPYEFAGGAPRLFQSSTFKVYDKYWIDNCKEALRFAPEHTACGNPYFPWHYEDVVYDVTHEYCGSLPPGKYICHSDDIKREYNPLQDKNPLILRFANVGKTSKINEKAILEFVSEYGLLKEQETLYPSVNIPYQKYSVFAFYHYAREAYLISKLYKALINKNRDRSKIVILISNLFKTDNVNLTYYQLGNWRKLLAREYYNLPEDVQNSIKDESVLDIEDNLKYSDAEKSFLVDQFSPNFVIDKIESLELAIENGEPFKRVLEKNEPFDLAMINKKHLKLAIEDAELFKQAIENEEPYDLVIENNESCEVNRLISRLERPDVPWQSILANASNEFIFDLCADIIATITNLRISADSVLYVKPISPSIGREDYQFVGSSGSLTLLSCMWLLFYLMITNQLEVYYRECLHCGLPIENPRSNQKYCSNEKCRQGYNTKLKRAVQKLWKEGNSKEEILEKVDVGTEQVENWTTSSR